MLIYALKRGDCPWSDPPEPVYADGGWLEDSPANGLCPACRCVNRSRFPAPLDVVLENEPGGELCCRAEGANVVLWRREFIEMIGEHLGDFVVGRCLSADGAEMADYVTCYGPHTIVIRGNRQSRYAVCPDCQSVISHVRPGPEYVLKRYLTDAGVYQDAVGNFFFAEEIALRLKLDRWNENEQMVYIEALGVRDEPADGKILPGD